MLVIEAKLKGSQNQYKVLDEMILTGQFIRNSCLRYWMENKDVKRNDLQKLCSVLAKDSNFPWVKKLNSQARQASAHRTWQSIQRFYKNCRLKLPGKKGDPKFNKFTRSIEYKSTGYKLSPDRKKIEFKDGFQAGVFELWTSRDLVWYSEQQISRVRVVRRADGYYCQFLVNVERKETHNFQGNVVGIDLGLNTFYTDSNGNVVENPKYLRKSEKRLKKLQRKVSRRHEKGKKAQSNNYHKARKQLARQHLKISRQRKDHAVKTARALIQCHDLVVYEDLNIANLVKNHHLAKSISDASWYQFTEWLEYYAKLHGIACIAVPPHFTSQNCSNCGQTVKKSLSVRTHKCPHCSYIADRDHNAARNILAKGLEMLGAIVNSTEGHSESGGDPKATGESDLWFGNSDIVHLSHLCERRIINDENPAS
ncbi:MAG: IS200/IS605 family element transposase accessory protein TnpB [Okeania sp. SIO2G4]|uniref:RNA-guided endonuclease InsQ/TnpB family protein n=1 Tax=unclassified Okeania TaxID=2634635 RepID=UPI0013B69D58|nr:MULTISPECIES: transposase [unclassified Okeania]NEP05072.1 IS200/IS605 family element transposase accessory protein TnpB [Okeania sp. SIO4D6]NEP76329.1 IS200/IS605 family element transposase accessory protein TnpB [Okeania sp. SIO2G5]NEP97360.1 IS200/IS605 family element transposase accessory protein TnpB [Okeania sp. SIO2F5]NEQ95091.1 IS200/IS605 family element transposase accessory protein TnpB [Okeania sp. SIO2G4]